MKDLYISLEQIGRLLKERSKLIIVSAMIFTGLYLYVVKYYGQSFGIFYYKKVTVELPIINERPEYNFYSGSVAGVYHKIVDVLKGESGSEFKECFVDVHNEGTSGGYENVLKVLGDSNGQAFGLVQEEAYNHDHMVRTELNYVTPIYMERLHIVFNNKSSKVLRISSNTDPETLRFLARSRLDIGSPNSGTHIISRYIINQLNEQIARLNINRDRGERLDYITRITNNGLKETYKDLVNNTEEVLLFLISGAPNESINKLQKASKEIDFVGVEPDFTAAINDKYDIHLHFSSFQNKYERFKNVTTVGTFAWLVTNMATPPADIREVLQTMHDNKSILDKMLGINNLTDTTAVSETDEPPHKILSPLSEFDFLGHYNNKNEKVISRIWRNILLFLISLIPSTILFFHVISLLLSTSKTDRFHDIIVDLINKNIPANGLPSIFYFVKLEKTNSSLQLTNKEYLYLKSNSINLLLLLFQDKPAFTRSMKKLKHFEIAKLATILITTSKNAIDWKSPNLSLAKNIAQTVDDGKTYYFEADNLIAERIMRETKLSQLALDPKAAVIKFLTNLLSYQELQDFLSNNDWYKEDFKSFDERLITPFVMKDQASIINRIIQGISKLYELKIRISEDYTDGLLTERHYNFLYEKVNYVLERMQDGLAIRLSEVIAGDYNLEVSPEQLRKFYVSNYLRQKDYYYLVDKQAGNLNWEGNY